MSIIKGLTSDDIKKVMASRKRGRGMAGDLQTLPAVLQRKISIRQLIAENGAEKKDGAYAAASTKIILRTTSTYDASAIESAEPAALTAWSGTFTDVMPGDTLSPNNAYRLVYDADNWVSLFKIQGAAETNLAIFAEHFNYLHHEEGAATEPSYEVSSVTLPTLLGIGCLFSVCKCSSASEHVKTFIHYCNAGASGVLFAVSIFLLMPEASHLMAAGKSEAGLAVAWGSCVIAGNAQDAESGATGVSLELRGEPAAVSPLLASDNAWALPSPFDATICECLFAGGDDLPSANRLRRHAWRDRSLPSPQLAAARVRAWSAAGMGQWSASSEAMQVDPVRPAQPQPPERFDLLPRSVVVHWKASESYGCQIVGFALRYAESRDMSRSCEVTGIKGDASSFPVTSLRPAQTYYFQALARYGVPNPSGQNGLLDLPHEVMRVQVALLSGHAAFIEAEADWSIQKFRRRAQDELETLHATVRRPRIVSNRRAHAFACICMDGSVLAWGAQAAGDCSHVRETCLQRAMGTALHRLLNPEAHRSLMAMYCCTLLENGEVVTWGDHIFGGDTSSLRSTLKEVRETLGVATGMRANAECAGNYNPCDVDEMKY
eukprot:g15229.t1